MTNLFRFVYIPVWGAFYGFNILQGQSIDPATEVADLRLVIQTQREQITRLQDQLEALDRRLETLANASVNSAEATRSALAGLGSPLSSAQGQASLSTGAEGLTAALFQTPAKLLAPSPAKPQVVTADSKPEASAPKRWYEKYSLRGYSQFRTNRIFTDNSNLVCEQCDRSIGVNNNFLVRRARLVLSGDVNDRIAIYFQPDFASTSGSLHFGQIRDLYFDVALDKKKEYRFRFGQSKIPFGFENMQSSQNRLALDRSDPINSALPLERDLGALFYWAPDTVRKRFAYLVASGLKGSGDYGVFAAGVFNGQGANKAEVNNNLHFVSRFSYPWELRNKQVIEAGIQGYTGRYTVTPDQRTSATNAPGSFSDRRVAASFMLYPQPYGFQAEYNVGTGPQFNPKTMRIESQQLHGGYVQAMYMRRFYGQVLTPYLRYQYYDGGKKPETDARSYLVKSLEAGIEWQQSPFMEWTAEFVHGDRTFEDGRSPVNRQTGNLLRLQLQLNY